MKRTYIFVVASLLFISTAAWAQKPKTTTQKPAATLSNAEKMGYARTNKYWGPGTYYLYAPGKPINKMADNAESAMRDLTGISEADLHKELSKQGFVEIPSKESKKAWYNENKSKDIKFYYSADKTYVLKPSTIDLYNSPVTETGKYAYASGTIARYVLIPKQDSLKVIEAVWQYLRDMNDMKVLLGSFGTNFKKANPKAFPIQRVGSAGWTGLRAGSWALTMEAGKPKGHWESNETIIRRTIGMPDFHLSILAHETDFEYGLTLKLKKEGYVLCYLVIASNISNLEPGNTWVKEYPEKIKEQNLGVKTDKEAVDVYKKAPFPPVLLDLDKALHIK